MAVKGKEKGEKSLAPWRPITELSRWERDTDRMMDELFDRRVRSWWPERWFGGERLRVDVPAVDMYEDKDDVVVKAELPGIEKDNIEVNLADNTLTIKGVKKKQEETKNENYYRSERYYGSVMRSVELPRDVQADKVKASFKNGVLEIRMPKTEEAKTREIKVKVD